MEIQRYSLGFYQGTQTIYMPEGAVITQADLVSGALYIWAYIDPTRAYTNRNFSVVPDNMYIPGIPKRYIGRVPVDSWNCYHILEIE